MSNMKKRVLIIACAIGMALFMGAVDDGPDIGAESASTYDATMQVAGHQDGHDGGGGG